MMWVCRSSKESYVLTSYSINTFISLRWMIEVERIRIINPAMKLKRNSMLAYSINSNDDLVNTLKNIIQFILEGMPDKDLELFGLKRKSDCLDIYLGGISSYEFNISNDKSYVIKTFDADQWGHLPSGFSSAYLNRNTGFKSLGFMGVNTSRNRFKYFYISVEETPNFYISLRSLDIFKDNVVQAFYFLLYILDLLNSLNLYKVHFEQPWDFYSDAHYLDFAVDSSNDKKWRFGLNDPKVFAFCKNENIFRNLWILNLIVDKLSKVFISQALLGFFIKLKDSANKLKDSNDNDFINILTNMINTKLFDLKNMPQSELMDINRNECVIQ